MVNKDMNIIEAVRAYPVIVNVFRNHGLGCVGCMAAAGETIGEGLSAHGLDVEAIIQEMNDLISQNK